MSATDVVVALGYVVVSLTLVVGLDLLLSRRGRDR